MMVVLRPPEPPPSARREPDAGVIEDARERQRRHRVIGVFVAVLVVGIAVARLTYGGDGGGGGAVSPQAVGGPVAAATEARWTALERCLVRAERALSASNPGSDGRVRLIGGRALDVYDDPQPTFAGLVGVFESERTFTQAQRTANATPLRPHALKPGIGTSAGLAIGNVAYYFTGWASTPARTAMADCLVSAYHGQPRWPANVDPASLASWPGGLYRR